MIGWHFTKLAGRVQHAEFLHIGQAVHEFLEERLEREMTVTAGFYHELFVFNPWWDRDVQERCDWENRGSLLLEATSLSDVSEAHWRTARSVRLAFWPAEPDYTLPRKRMIMEFKGRHPGRATFYGHPECIAEEDDLCSMAERLCPDPGWRWWAFGSWKTHGRCTDMIPTELANLLAK